jgi:RNA polymerase sigma-70 factor (ECF subfamily)
MTTQEDFAAFFRADHRRLVSLGAAMTGSVHVGEELAQEALWRVHEQWDRLAGYEDIGAWTRRVLVNLAIDVRRRRLNEAKAMERLGRARRLVPGDHTADLWWAAVRSLPDRQAAIVALHYLEDRSVDSIAEVLGVTSGTVKSTLAHARAALAARLDREDFT